MNWQILLTIGLLTIGIILLVIYPDCSGLTAKEKNDRKIKRNIGWVFIIISIGIGIYICYTNRIKFNAKFPPGEELPASRQAVAEAARQAELRQQATRDIVSRR